ncbi:unnamed protein product [Ambrosiozyma monospora]|uniref:Unnamed protein product n=1 Tax=Ambrosiozyma monospora TaxID=43982 RepID=A0A9W6WCU0_AMBMO|nr:unnamed protein product [Ambrosiozyma monospora]
MEGEKDENPWKKITRLRIDPVDMSFICNDNSKFNWIQSGKVELIADIMLPNIEARDTTLQQFIDQQSILQQLKYLGDNVINQYKSATNNSYTPIEKQPKTSLCSSVEENKYVVMDVKLSFSDLKATNPRNIPHSSITHAPYISAKDLRSLVTFINDKKYGLSSITSKAMHRYSQEELDDDQIAAISATTTSSSSSTTSSTTINSTDSSVITNTTGGFTI